ncbi:flavodoxin family protein [Lactobacillus sp. Sy-1]|uniref:flavodoxin family protein n=1 Tax=Lactobacillus sp. Sy-1 TaxID=2109645 RepID=UPI001C5A86CE|nr:NAD(P)H-dependent oxidoreductase [Lactobacillus sp. Sy-1]MBW1606185.1 flavodoxin family protein [Lactobacillus sp. Sy-1]
MENLFINASKDPNGLTEELVKQRLNIDQYETINLVEYMIYPLGQEMRPGDQFKTVCDQVKQAHTIIVGTPVYWSSMSAYMKILIDRMTQVMGPNNPFAGKDLYLIIDGMEPSDTIQHVTHVWEHVAGRFDMQLVKVVHN